jgi:anthranilate synthase
LRNGFDPREYDRIAPNLVVMSPGPGSPKDFDTAGTIRQALERKLPIFGVCLGLQALIEYFGGELGVLGYPMHGKPSEVTVRGGRLFKGIPPTFIAGRYHSLHAVRVPDEIEVTAHADEPNIVMAIEHRTLPIAAVQFHPESILTADGDRGLGIIHNCVRTLAT